MQGPEAFPISGVTLDDEATACWQLAARIGSSGKQRSPSDPARSFTSLLLALLYGSNVWSRWFLRYATAVPVQLTDMAEALGFDPQQLKTIRNAENASPASPSTEGWTASANNIVNGAAELHRLCSAGDLPLGVRHLLGAYFYRLPSDHDAQMKRWGFELPREASALLRQVKQRMPDEEKAWVDLHLGTFKEPPSLDAGDPLPPPRISGFAADSPEGDDQLDIEDDVYALSALLCSTRITPPLSVGLFGDWGSGKSFFIRQLQKGAAWISTQARSSKQLQRDLPFYKNVVQIEFNAWNYSAGNLWAALVQHILENLRLSRDEPNDLVEARRKHLQQTMELERKVRDAAEHKRDEAQRKLTQAQIELRKSRDLHEEKVKQLAQMRAGPTPFSWRVDSLISVALIHGRSRAAHTTHGRVSAGG